jgi:hypothetical protein
VAKQECPAESFAEEHDQQELHFGIPLPLFEVVFSFFFGNETNGQKQQTG